MHVAAITGLLVVFFVGLSKSELKNPLVKLTKRCDSSLPVLHGKHWAHDWDARMDFKCPGSKYVPITSYSNSCVQFVKGWRAKKKMNRKKKQTETD